MSSEIKVNTISEKTSANGVSIDGLTIKDGGITATTGDIIFNEASANVDFRVESNGNTHMLTVDGGDNRVGVGASSLDGVFNVAGATQTVSSRLGVLFESTTAGADNGLPLVFTSNLQVSGDGLTNYGVASIAGRKTNADKNNAVGYLQFGTANVSGAIVERMRITEAGLHIGGTGAANALDDYEEGTFTVSLTGGTGGTSYTMASGHETGHYTKIGNRVYINMYIRSSSINSAGSTVVVNGLPFTSSSTARSYGNAVGTYANNLNLGAAGYNVVGYVGINGTLVFLQNFDGTTGTSGLTSAEWSDNGECMLQITYAV